MEEATRGTQLVSTTCTQMPVRKTIWFSQMSLESLRELAKWPDGTRTQILAWCKNRYKCGFMYEYMEPIHPSFHI